MAGRVFVEHARLTDNNINLLRLLLAGTICVAHAARLSGNTQLASLHGLLASDVRVSAFFVMSGFLIFRSYERSSSPGTYLRKRVRAIYPAYTLTILASAFGLLSVSTLGLREYFSADWLAYVFFNLTFLNFLQPSLPGVFENNALSEVNGALWTMKVEVMFYASVPAFMWLFRCVGRMRVLATTYVLSALYVMFAAAVGGRAGDELARQLPGQLTYLMAGAFCYYYLPQIERHARALAGATAIAAVLLIVQPMPVVKPLVVAMAVMLAALFTPPLGVRRGRNLSYALFLVHFPVIQLLADRGWLAVNPLLALAEALAAAGTAAVVLYLMMRWTQPVSPERTPHVPASATAAAVAS